MKTGTLVAAGAVAVALAAGAVWAQAPRLREAVHGSCGLFRMLAAHHSIHELGLTEQQKTQIKGILRAHRQEFRESVDRLRGIHEAVRKAADQETIDEAAIRQTVSEATGPLGDFGGAARARPSGDRSGADAGTTAEG